MRQVTKPGFVFNVLILLSLVVTTVLCAIQLPHTGLWIAGAVASSVLAVLWLARWVFLWLMWAAAHMVGLGEPRKD